MKQLDPKYVWQYLMKGLLVLPFLPIIGIFSLTDIADFLYKYVGFSLKASWVVLCVFVFVFVFVVWILAKLTYRFYRYELREEGFRKESGIVWKKYHTIPYGRIQNVDIYRGISDRILGLSYIFIQTAGRSNPYFQEGKIPGLSIKMAEQLRDELIQRVNNVESF